MTGAWDRIFLHCPHEHRTPAPRATGPRRHPGHAVEDLTKTHLDTFIGGLSGFSPKSRNHYRASIRQFLQWSVRKDYISATHRLLEADSMRPEHAKQL